MRSCHLVPALLAMMIWNAFLFAQDNYAGRNAAAESARNVHRREQWFTQGRSALGEPNAAARYLALRQKMALRATRGAQARSANLPANALSGVWIQLGPAPVVSDASGVGLQDYNYVAGRATAVAIDPADPTGNTVYVGGAYGGIWKSTNAGPLSPFPESVGWVPLTDNQATLSIGSIAIQPQSNNPYPAKSIILAGTGETNGSSDSYYGLGILRSADAGNTWTLIKQDGSVPPRKFAGLGFGKIAFSTNNPNLVVAAAGATAQGIIEAAENPAIASRGIYFSTNAGVSWMYATASDGPGATIDPASVTDVVYNAAANQFFAAVSLHGIYSSADGMNWSRLPNQPGSLSAASCPAHVASPSMCPIYRGELAVVPGRNEMYAWFVDANDNDGDIWTSLTGGASWTEINDSGITSCGDLFGGCGTEQGSYALALAAVPDGTATDLYAGSVNLYKCTISVISPNCSGTGSGTFINLTHAYGCSSIAKVHPAQHSIAFMLINNNSEDVMYFANDGGLYRALDGYTGLLSDSCGSANLFDSLNQTLGSMTELVSFSESSLAQNPSPYILLAGAQANGSPGTITAQSSTAWQNVNAGDGGPTAISPDDDNLWFASNPPDSVSGVNIFRCDSGVNCTTQEFQNNQIVSGPTVGGDAGAFNTPFILDPQNSADMIIGTCRVWRGPSAGGSFSDLSNNFETGDTGICSGTETNLVRALDAGGTLDANGFSNVIYAGTDGTGPLATGLPTGGHLWVSTNAGGGPSTWMDRTGAINAQHFPIAAIAIDNSDLAGLTAYVGIMGFGVSHIWKTITGGASWIDFTGNLPDAPVNALLVDYVPGRTPGTIYAGTDVGVFVSSTTTPGWTEVGPSPGSNSSGFLPNVAVTALHIFNPSGSRHLRSSTYGRGLWELSGFTLSPPIPAAVTVGATGTSPSATLQLTVATGLRVNLSCDVPSWAVCSISGGGPTLAINVSPSNPYTLTVTATTLSAPSGPFLVAIHAAAPGYTTETQNLSVTVTGGFAFSITNMSGPQTVTAGQSATYDLNVVPSSGTFPSAVALTFNGCPAASTCSLSPTVVRAGAGTTQVVMTIATSPQTTAGSYSSITVTGTSGVITASASLSLTVQSTAFSFSISSAGPPTITAGSSGKYDITITPSVGTFPNPVALSFTGCPAASTCSLSSTQVTAGSGTTDIFLTVATTAGTAAGSYTVTVTGTSGSLSANTNVSLTVQGVAQFNFSLSNSGSQTIAAGKSALFDITVTPSFGTFPNPVAMSFSACLQVVTCSLDTAQVPAGNGTTVVHLTMATTGPGSRAAEGRAGILFFATWLPLPGLVIVFGGTRTAPSRRKLRVLLLMALLAVSAGCGGLQGGSAAPAVNPGTPAGVYSVTVIGTSGSLTADTSISLTVQAAQ
ncbi:MAG: hypothetical protein ACRD2U_09075 [Terriglobales bacterium]